MSHAPSLANDSGVGCCPKVAIVEISIGSNGPLLFAFGSEVNERRSMTDEPFYAPDARRKLLALVRIRAALAARLRPRLRKLGLSLDVVLEEYRRLELTLFPCLEP